MRAALASGPIPNRRLGPDGRVEAAVGLAVVVLAAALAVVGTDRVGLAVESVARVTEPAWACPELCGEAA